MLNLPRLNNLMFNYKKIIGMEEKISIAEINRLMEEAEQERREHRRVMRLVQQIKDEGWGAVSGLLTKEEQLHILRRRRYPEIHAMLQAYADLHLERFRDGQLKNLCEEAQREIFSWKGDEDLGSLFCYMVENNVLSPQVEKDFVLCCLPHPFWGSRFNKMQYLPETEVFVLRELQKKPPFACFDALTGYIRKWRLSMDAETELMKCIGIFANRDKYAMVLNVAKWYIQIHRCLCLPAERELIKSGNHDLIMFYIKEAKDGLSAKDELFERGNREEVEDFIFRYRMG